MLRYEIIIAFLRDGKVMMNIQDRKHLFIEKLQWHQMFILGMICLFVSLSFSPHKTRFFQSAEDASVLREMIEESGLDADLPEEYLVPVFESVCIQLIINPVYFALFPLIVFLILLRKIPHLYLNLPPPYPFIL